MVTALKHWFTASGLVSCGCHSRWWEGPSLLSSELQPIHYAAFGYGESIKANSSLLHLGTTQVKS